MIIPTVKANGINIYYEVKGEGTPLLLIEGLGYATWMWYRQEKLQQNFQLIKFDNRGVGGSDKPQDPYSVELMAQDAAQLMEALEIDKANVLGVSLGGFIAQELAYSYPDKVEKLILCSTSFGGPNSIPIPQETLEVMQKGGGEYSSLDELRNAVGVALDRRLWDENQDIIDKILHEKSTNPQPKHAYLRQMEAGAAFNGEEKTSHIKAPTLILAAKGDRVVPWENAQLLHDKIPHSRLELLSEGGHLFFMERPDTANNLIREFLKED
ncbi:alpha/beta fold hydrolase [Natranaerobius thermophilus]|uniref:alpha/beta fold hydrolase n=1 Tax=Natranaerobius thermophilus TaxID=375929 RepID=UPI0001669582|nr:alpha/beta hydrolase [Natranaerobius thermophilus]